jgi:hypothetical protein
VCVSRVASARASTSALRSAANASADSEALDLVGTLDVYRDLALLPLGAPIAYALLQLTALLTLGPRPCALLAHRTGEAGRTAALLTVLLLSLLSLWSLALMLISWSTYLEHILSAPATPKHAASVGSAVCALLAALVVCRLTLVGTLCRLSMSLSKKGNSWADALPADGGSLLSADKLAERSLLRRGVHVHLTDGDEVRGMRIRWDGDGCIQDAMGMGAYGMRWGWVHTGCDGDGCM